MSRKRTSHQSWKKKQPTKHSPKFYTLKKLPTRKGIGSSQLIVLLPYSKKQIQIWRRQVTELICIRSHQSTCSLEQSRDWFNTRVWVPRGDPNICSSPRSSDNHCLHHCLWQSFTQLPSLQKNCFPLDLSQHWPNKFIIINRAGTSCIASDILVCWNFSDLGAVSHGHCFNAPLCFSIRFIYTHTTNTSTHTVF